jgi:hypothetical protein
MSSGTDQNPILIITDQEALEGVLVSSPVLLICHSFLSSLAPSIDKVRTKLKDASRIIEEQVETFRTGVPAAEESAEAKVDPSELDLLVLPLHKEKRRRGRPSKEQQNQGKKKKKEYVTLTERERDLLKDDFREGKSVKFLADKYGVATGTVSKIGRETDKPKRRGGHVYEKITQAASVLMTDSILDDPTTTSSELQAKLGDIGIHVAQSTINHHLNSARMEQHRCPVFSLKRLRVHEEARASEQTKEARIDYVNRFMEARAGGKMFVYIDETSFNTFEYCTMGRSPVGQRCIIRRRRVKTESITAITAICEYTGVLQVTFVDGPVDNAVFRVFLLSLIQKLQTFIKESCVFVMDNVALHKTANVRALMNEKNYTPLYTAPNSCELNPIEYVFGIWKARLKIPQEVRTTAQLMEYLTTSVSAIRRIDVSRCINMVYLKVLPLAKAGRDLSLRDLANKLQEDHDLIEHDDNEDNENDSNDETEHHAIENENMQLAIREPSEQLARIPPPLVEEP